MGSVAVRLNDETKTVLAIPRVKEFLEKLVEGVPLKEAALGAGLRTKRAKLLLQIPAVRREYFRQIEAVQESEKARNVALRVAVRDRGFAEDAPAAMVRQSLIAADRLDGIDGRAGGTNVTVSVANSIAGYVMDLREPDQNGLVPPLVHRGREVLESEAVEADG